MAQTIRDIMNTNVVTVQSTDSVTAAAQIMRDANIGDVLVMEDDRLSGILTDRDIVVRALAEGKDLDATRAGEIASHELTTVSPEDDASQAVQRMREKAIRRLPVLEGGKLVGVLSIGDLAMERQPDSPLADISEAPPNR
jgi:CBS domain-containing protein